MCAFYRWAGGLWLWQARREGLAGWRAAGRSGLQACRRFRRHGRGAMDGTLGSVGCPAMGAGFSTATDHHLQPAAKVLPAAVALLLGTCLRLPARSLPKNNLDPAAPGEHALTPSRPYVRRHHHHHRHHRRLTFASVLVPRYDRVTRVRRPASLPPAGQTSRLPCQSRGRCEATIPPAHGVPSQGSTSTRAVLSQTGTSTQRMSIQKISYCPS